MVVSLMGGLITGQVFNKADKEDSVMVERIEELQEENTKLQSTVTWNKQQEIARQAEETQRPATESLAIITAALSIHSSVLEVKNVGANLYNEVDTTDDNWVRWSIGSHTRVVEETCNMVREYSSLQSYSVVDYCNKLIDQMGVVLEEAADFKSADFDQAIKDLHTIDQGLNKFIETDVLTAM